MLRTTSPQLSSLGCDGHTRLRMAKRGGCADRLLTEDGRTPCTNASGSPVVTGLSKKGVAPWCIAVLGSDGWRVERAATLHPWRRFIRYDEGVCGGHEGEADRRGC